MATVYATLAEFKLRCGSELYNQLTDLSGGTTPSDTVGQARLEDSEGYVNARIAARYVTPVDVSADATLANTMRALTCAVCAYDMLSMHPDTMGQLREGVDERFRHWIELLKDIQNGKAALPGAAVIPPPASSGSPAIVVGNRPVFGDIALEGLP